MDNQMYEFELHQILRRQPLKNGGEVNILRQLDCRFGRGRISAVIGPSGGGKSTLLRLLNRLDDPDEGEILRRGYSLASYPVRQLRRKVALLSQQTTVFDTSLKENLQLPLTLSTSHPFDLTNEVLNAILEEVGLRPELLDRSALDLSGGEKQRLGLARILLTRPEVMLLDEPTSAQDPPAREQLVKLLRRQADSGMTLILASHDISFVRRLADDFFFLHRGQIVAGGTVAELERPQNLELRHFITAEGEP